MISKPVVISLPIGEFDSEPIKKEFSTIIEAINQMGAEVVIADSISDEEGIQRFSQNISGRNFDLLLVIILRGASAQLIETVVRMSQAPCLVWPVQGRYALPSSTLAIGALKDSRIPVELLYAPPEHPVSLDKIRCLTKAARAYSRIKRSRIGIIGDLFPNLVSCRYDSQTINSKLGVTLLPVTFEEVREAIELVSKDTEMLGRLGDEIAGSYSVDVPDMHTLDSGIKLHLALKRVALEHEVDGFAAECWTGFPQELGLNPCLGFMEDAYTLACEGDVMLCVSLLMVRYLTGIYAYVGDIYDLDLDGVLTLIHCGAPASLASNKKEVVLGKSQLALERGFDTITCRPRLGKGTVTLLRFYGSGCDKMHVATGMLLSSELSPSLMVNIRLDGNRWDFLDQCFGNHYVIVAGDIRGELKVLCAWLGITIFET